MPHTVRVNGRRRAVEACQDVGQGIALLRGSGRHLPTRAPAHRAGWPPRILALTRRDADAISMFR